MFSKATEYALRATIYIAQKGTVENKIVIGEISKAIDAPQSFTAKILQALRKDNKIIRSVSGPNGGFFMTEKAKKLPVRTILKAMGEDEVLDKCVLGLDKCSETQPCPMHSKYKIIKEQLIALFETKTIQQLADDIKNGDVFINNKDKQKLKLK
ncbi:MAG: Rrf2 family transcriptional regulator [Hydrotalea flava]|uniref:RrF2 family transcriptional regulator n=1 Tax=Hydrotalea TaxID=1004300 RepID=UPI0009435D61|nr:MULTISPECIES: Rrf2 family transcriptional regulator [Hydrotalea]MBY0348543.1 Rrf2 family transcriptional regulator [Hydrotalea flava]NIM34137.1 Rrf2 family transcriptional regulator [Hydrotalea flava]NIM36961.1 Rrf2 family transcriptional regulator [Hydrotalea flava]NIN02153.1 Rrf2 family transcriptional regulator [Hydrotalea flava]NIN13806.1 Rrf2 family transcriptional regulator [Hydrotalea flava]